MRPRIPPIRTCPRWYSRARHEHADHYATLKLPRNASKQQVKARFYELSKQYHPDSPTGSPSLFHTINDAYSVLGDDGARAAYDASTRPATATTGSKFHPHSPQARRTAGPHRAWAKPPPGAAWTGGRKYDGLGWGMGMGGNMGGPAPQRGRQRFGRKEQKVEREGGERERESAESGLWRFVVVVVVLFGIVAVGGGFTASAEGGDDDGETNDNNDNNDNNTPPCRE